MPYVAVTQTTLEELAHALEELERVERALSRTARQLGELGQDLCDDAVLRLRERHAAEPQITSYRDGWALRQRALSSNVQSLTDVRRELRASLTRLRGFGGTGSDHAN